MKHGKWEITCNRTVFDRILVRIRHEGYSYLVIEFKTRKEAADLLRALRKCTN